MKMSNLDDFDVDHMGEAPTPPQPGWYHVKLIKHDTKTTTKGTQHKCTWQIVGATPELQSELGKYVYDSYFEYSSIFAKQMATLGWACGIYTKEQLKALQAKGENLPTPDLHTWLYVSCIARVKHEADQDDATKVYARLALYEQKPVDAPIVKEIGIVLDEASLSSEHQPANSADNYI